MTIHAHVAGMLSAIRNQPPGRMRNFLWPTLVDPSQPARYGVRWWRSNDPGPFYNVAFALTEIAPAVLDRYTVDQLCEKAEMAVIECLPMFDMARFAQASLVTLADCASDTALATIADGLTEWAQRSTRTLLMTRVRKPRPPRDLLDPSLVWLRHYPTGAEVAQLLRLSNDSPVRPFVTTLQGWPPLDPSDSLLGIVAHGSIAGARKLKCLAGALCVALPDPHASVILLIPPEHTVTWVSSEGVWGIGPGGPFMPCVGGLDVLSDEDLMTLRALLRPRFNAEGENRLRMALEFLATGWLLPGTQKFANYFIALDVLFGSKRDWDKPIRAGVRERLKLAPDDDRVGRLLGIRGELLHGDCASVETSRGYLHYRRKLLRHPTDDVFAFVRGCIRAEAEST